MADTTNRVITEQITRTSLEGAEKAIADAKKLDAALDGVVVSSEATEKSLLSAEKALHRVNLQFEPGYREAKRLEAAQRDLKRAFDQGLVSTEDYERKLKLISGANDNFGKSTGLARHQVQNLTAQMVDFGVQISSGGGILLPLIQQGPQAVDAVGGLSKAMELLRQRWQALSVVTRGGIMAGGAAVAIGLTAKAVLDLSTALARMTQPERLEDSMERVTKGFKAFIEQADLYFGRKISNFIIDANNEMAASWDALAEKIRKASERQGEYNAKAAQAGAGFKAFMEEQSAAAAGTTPGQIRAALPNLGLTPPALPGPLSEELQTPIFGGHEGRKEMIDGISSGFERAIDKAGFQQLPSKFGDTFGRVWAPKVDAQTRTNKDGFNGVERAIDEAADRIVEAQRRYGEYTGPTGGFDADKWLSDQIAAGSFKPSWEIADTPRGPMTFETTEGQQRFGTFSKTGAIYDKAGGDILSYMLGQTAAGRQMLGTAAGGTVDTSALDPIGDLIERLRDQQDAVMQREYRPDPYSDKNPDIFYGNGKQFRAEQDRIWQSLQNQIDTLTDLRVTAEQQLLATQSLPEALASALVGALVQAGLSGDQIASAMATLVGSGGTTPTTTPQTGYLSNRMGITEARALRSTFVGY